MNSGCLFNKDKKFYIQPFFFFLNYYNNMLNEKILAEVRFVLSSALPAVGSIIHKFPAKSLIDDGRRTLN